ncbi:unnamed protein product, partial [marine sediment metagenome]
SISFCDTDGEPDFFLRGLTDNTVDSLCQVRRDGADKADTKCCGDE